MIKETIAEVITMDNVFVELKQDPLNFYRMERLSTWPHLHKEIELIYVVNGAADCYADRQCFPVSSGDVFIAFPSQIHYYLNSTPGDYYVFVTSADAIWGLKKLFFDHKPTQNAVYEQQNTPIAALFKDILEQQGEYKETMQAGLLNQLLCHILGELNLKPQIKTDNSTLHNILNYCTQNFTEEIALEDVAEALHLNKYHISHLINQKLGIGFSAYINTLRVDRACEQLADSAKNIADISAEAGFGSIRSFNRVFSQIMHMTPLEYRRQSSRKEKAH